MIFIGLNIPSTLNGHVEGYRDSAFEMYLPK